MSCIKFWPRLIEDLYREVSQKIKMLSRTPEKKKKFKNSTSLIIQKDHGEMCICRE